MKTFLRILALPAYFIPIWGGLLFGLRIMDYSIEEKLDNPTSLAATFVAFAVHTAVIVLSYSYLFAWLR